MPSPIFLIVLLLAAAAPARAGSWETAVDRCRSWFGALEKPALSPEERSLFARAFAPGGSHPYSAEANLDPELFYEGLSLLPAPIRYRLFHLPSSETPYRAMEALYPELSAKSFLDQVLKKLDREGSREVEAKLASFLASRRGTAAPPSAAWLHSVERARARAVWDASAGEVLLEVHERGGKDFVRIGPDEYPARREGNSIILEVPREKVAHPFWNPVAPEKVMNMARAGVKAPKRFETLLGYDGKFYLVDGNHRFQLDGRKIIPVEIAPHSVNLRAMLDLIGVPQPNDPDQITRYVQGAVSWEDFVPAEKRKTFVITPAAPALAPAP